MTAPAKPNPPAGEDLLEAAIDAVLDMLARQAADEILASEEDAAT